MIWDEATALKQEPAPIEDWEGKLPKESNEYYHRRPELSSSDIKHMLKSPRHFKRLCLEKHLIERDANPAFDLGHSAHECYLEQTTDNFVCAPDVDRRTKQGKIDYDTFATLNTGKRIISADQHKRVKAMFEVIASNPKASEIVSKPGVLIEESFLYRDDSGLRCKFRPDVMWVGDEHIEIADYKTAEAASPHEFAKSVARYHYHLSAAHYIVGAQRLYNRPVTKYTFVVQEKSEPYAVAIYRMSLSDIARSIELRAALMGRIADCTVRNDWPDWSADERTISVPGYAFEMKEAQ